MHSKLIDCTIDLKCSKCYVKESTSLCHVLLSIAIACYKLESAWVYVNRLVKQSVSLHAACPFTISFNEIKRLPG